MKAYLVTVAALAATPVQAMTVAEFLGKIDGLYARGPFFWTSPDYKLVKAEGVASTSAWRAQAHAPNACPPSRDVAIGQSDYLALIRAVPGSQRQQSVAQAVTTALNKRWPCA
jgi:hypothetical protein